MGTTGIKSHSPRMTSNETTDGRLSVHKWSQSHLHSYPKRKTTENKFMYVQGRLQTNNGQSFGLLLGVSAYNCMFNAKKMQKCQWMRPVTSEGEAKSPKLVGVHEIATGKSTLYTVLTNRHLHRFCLGYRTLGTRMWKARLSRRILAVP